MSARILGTEHSGLSFPSSLFVFVPLFSPSFWLLLSVGRRNECDYNLVFTLRIFPFILTVSKSCGSTFNYQNRVGSFCTVLVSLCRPSWPTSGVCWNRHLLKHGIMSRCERGDSNRTPDRVSSVSYFVSFLLTSLTVCLRGNSLTSNLQ